MVAPVPTVAKPKPLGRAPDAIVQLTLPPPNGFELHAPEAEMACWYAAPTAPFGRVAVVIVRVPVPPAGETVIENGFEVVAPERSETLMVKLKVPAVVGVPVTAPVVGIKPSPGGNVPPADH